MSHAATLDERTAHAALPVVHEPAAPARPRGRFARLALGADHDPRWARPALWGLLLVAALTYLWDLTVNGYANDFYAAAVKSSTKSWTAWFFGSLDSANSITVDKPPAAMWVMGLSARIFGFSSASMLVPEALMGIGTVAFAHACVRRWYGHGAALVAGALVVASPVAAMMFRFNNPDAMLTLLMSAAAYCVTRALETGKGRKALWWMVAAGSAIGFAFLTKMLQGMLVLPGFVLAYLVAAPRSWKARFGHLLAAFVSMVVSAGWFVLVADLWPAASRPWIGGSTNNTEWELALGYNGLGRVLGGSGNGGGAGGGGGFGGAVSLWRMFNSQFGTEVSWFLPAALLLLVAALVARGRAPRTDRRRAGLLLWGGWLVVTALVLSFMQGTVHSYYSVALVPAIAAVIGIGAREVHSRVSDERFGIAWRTVLGLAIAITAGWGFHLMASSAPSWHSWLRWVAVIGGVVGAMVYVALGAVPVSVTVRRFAVAALVIGSLSAVAPSAAWTAATVTVAHTGSMPTAGPASASTGGMGQMGALGGTRRGGTAPTGRTGSAPTGTAPTGTAPTGTAPTGTTGTAPTGAAPTGNTGTGAAPTGSTGTGTAPTGGSAAGSAKGSTARTGGMEGGSNSALVAALNKTTTTWSAAVIGDQSAAGYILNSDTAVMSIGGWSGSDNNVTLAQFKQYVADHKITYFIAGGGMGGGPGGSSGSGSEITAWVKANFTATTIGGTTVYNLTTAK